MHDPKPSPAPLPKTWVLREIDQQRVDCFAQTLGLSPLTARLLAGRELADTESARGFLNPLLRTLHDPEKMRDMDRAADRIARAVRDGERLAVYGDYDVDGLTATALLIRFLRWLGASPTHYIPNRLTEGYGMSRRGIDQLNAQGVQLIITVDNGITCNDEIAYARSLGIEVVVTDHHEPPEVLPEAVALVDPKRLDCPYPFKGLSGVGVAFKLAHAIARRCDVAEGAAKEFLKSLFDLVALGTVADVVPLLDENRVLALYGLRALEHTDKKGLQALTQLLGAGGRPLTGETIAFQFGPRLNAAGRTGGAEDGLELLLTEDENRSWQLCKYLDRLNDERRLLEDEVLREVFEQFEEQPDMLDDPVLIAWGDSWHQGILGIVASRLVERFGRPAIILGVENELAKGSARSIPNFDLFEALRSSEDILTTYGGHTMAAGLSLPVGNIHNLRETLCERARQLLGDKPQTPVLEIDTWADIDEMNVPVLEEIGRLRPFGHSNPQPVVALRGVRLAGSPREINGRHLKMQLTHNGNSRDTIGAIWFRCPAYGVDVLRGDRPLDVAGVPRINTWNNQSRIEITVKDIRPTEAF